MTTIDHRILIPASPELVWDYISDITRNPDWQVDCREVIFLTSRREGPGLRWRYSAPDGREMVISVSAWYNGLGYEYYIVDGAPFRENRGRIRLQEIPEGTVVQWTFTYELGGIFGGVRNALGMNRQIDRTIADSLKTLWQQIKKQAAGQNHEAKSLMRDAPDVEARSAYKPRHPSMMSQEERDEAAAQAERRIEQASVAEPPVYEGDGQRIHVIDEPPIADEDTRPRQPFAPPAEPAAVVQPDREPDIEPEPEFLSSLDDLSRFEPPRDLSDTQPRRSETPAPAVEPQPVESEAETELEPFPDEALAVENDIDAVRFDEQPEEPTAFDATEPLAYAPPDPLPGYLPAVPHVDEPTAPARREPEPAPPDDQPTVAAEPSIEHVIPEPPVTAADTASIWEVFGVPRPSETGEVETVVTDAVSVEPPPAVAETAAPEIRILAAPDRTGLRLRLRRKRIKLRRP